MKVQKKHIGNLKLIRHPELGFWRVYEMSEIDGRVRQGPCIAKIHPEKKHGMRWTLIPIDYKGVRYLGTSLADAINCWQERMRINAHFKQLRESA